MSLCARGAAFASCARPKIASSSRFLIFESVMPDGHEIVPLFGEFPDNRLEYVGDELAIFFDCAIRDHVNGRIGITSILVGPQLNHESWNHRRLRILPDPGGSRGKQGRASKKIHANAAIQIGTVDQHSHQLISTKRLNDFNECELVRTDGDGFDAESFSILVPPFIQFLGWLGHRHHVHGESISGENHSTQFPGAEMACDQKGAPPVLAPGFEVLKSEPFVHEGIDTDGTASGTITEVM